MIIICLLNKERYYKQTNKQIKKRYSSIEETLHDETLKK